MTEVKGKGTLQTYYVERKASSRIGKTPGRAARRLSREGRYRRSSVAESVLGSVLSSDKLDPLGGPNDVDRYSATRSESRLVLVVTDQIEDVLPLCRRLSCIGECRAVTSAHEACMQLANDEDVAVVVYRQVLLEAPDCGAELSSLLHELHDIEPGYPLQIAVADHVDEAEHADVSESFRQRLEDHQVVLRADQIDVKAIIKLLADASPASSPRPTRARGPSSPSRTRSPSHAPSTFS